MIQSLALLLAVMPPPDMASAQTTVVVSSASVVVSSAPAAVPAKNAKVRKARLSTLDRQKALHLFDLLVDDGRLQEAEKFQKRRYELALDTAAWTLRLARLRSAQRRHGESAEIYRRLVADAPDDTGFQVQLALQEQAAGKPAEAKRILENVRTKTSDPAVPYHLAELAYGSGDTKEGERWATAALEEMPTHVKGASERRMRLRLRARLGFDDALNSEYGSIAERERAEPQVLYDWVSALMRAGAAEEAGEPLALLRQRFPEQDLEIRKIEAERLRRLDDAEARKAHILRSLERYPEEPDFLYPRAEGALREKDWAPAEAAALRLAGFPAYARAAREMLGEARAEGRTHAGPFFRWRDSSGSRVLETGATLKGVPRRGWRARADAARSATSRKSAGTSVVHSGVRAEAARVKPWWEAGVDADLRGGGGLTAASPGLFGSWRRSDAFSASGRASVRRLWTDSAEAASAGVLTDDFESVLRGRPARRLALSLQSGYNRLSARAGGRAVQTLLAPEATLVLVDQPFFAAASYRYAMVNAFGDPSFFRALPLLPRSRTHYAALSAGKRWLDGRLRADGYVYNGHEPERGRRFGSGDLLGFGSSVEALLGRLTVNVGYDLSLEDTAGVGGRSHSLRVSALWRFGDDSLQAAEGRAR